MTSKSAPPPLSLTTRQLVKMAAPIVLFSILLPTVDNVTDLRMIIRLYTGITGCKELPWQEKFTCQEDPVTYCESNPRSFGCESLWLYGSPENIPGCKLIWQNDYICQEDPVTYCQSNRNSDECYFFERYGWVVNFKLNGTVRSIPGCRLIWQNEHACQEDPDTYCESNPKSIECDDFKRSGWVGVIPGCVRFICWHDPATFCEQRPDSPTCKPIKHTRFAIMFLGKY